MNPDPSRKFDAPLTRHLVEDEIDRSREKTDQLVSAGMPLPQVCSDLHWNGLRAILEVDEHVA